MGMSFQAVIDHPQKAAHIPAVGAPDGKIQKKGVIQNHAPAKEVDPSGCIPLDPRLLTIHSPSQQKKSRIGVCACVCELCVWAIKKAIRRLQEPRRRR